MLDTPPAGPPWVSGQDAGSRLSGRGPIQATCRGPSYVTFLSLDFFNSKPYKLVFFP